MPDTFTSTSRSPLGPPLTPGSPFFANTDTPSVINSCWNSNFDLLLTCGISGSAISDTFLLQLFLNCHRSDRSAHSVQYQRKTGMYKQSDPFHHTLDKSREKFPALHLYHDSLHMDLSEPAPALFHIHVCLFKRNADTFSDIGTFHRAITCSASYGTSEQISKDISENVSKISSIKSAAKSTCTSGTSLKCRVAELIILTTFVSVTQNGIGFRSLFELFSASLSPGFISGWYFFAS